MPPTPLENTGSPTKPRSIYIITLISEINKSNETAYNIINKVEIENGTINTFIVNGDNTESIFASNEIVIKFLTFFFVIFIKYISIIL